MSEPRKTASAPPANGGTSHPAPPTIVLDFGSRSAKKIKRLRKGQGPLMARVNESVGEFVRSETIPDASPVIVVVVKKRKKRGLFG